MKPQIADKIKASTYPQAIGALLDSAMGVDEKKARELFDKTKDTYAEKIRTSTDIFAISLLLESVREIDEETAKRLEKESKFK
ncbi:MAG: hypothetical protein J7K81_05275 [Methanophagales archaeon]|nr:hypothetical protein [Methanophagales archaeon]